VSSPWHRHLQLAGLSGICKWLLLLSGLVASFWLGAPSGRSLEIMLHLNIVIVDLEVDVFILLLIFSVLLLNQHTLLAIARISCLLLMGG